MYSLHDALVQIFFRHKRKHELSLRICNNREAVRSKEVLQNC